MTTILVEVTGEHKRAATMIKALATEIAGTMGIDGVKRCRFSSSSLYFVQFRSAAQAARFCRAVERFVPATLAKIHSP